MNNTNLNSKFRVNKLNYFLVYQGIKSKYSISYSFIF